MFLHEALLCKLTKNIHSLQQEVWNKIIVKILLKQVLLIRIIHSLQQEVWNKIIVKILKQVLLIRMIKLLQTCQNKYSKLVMSYVWAVKYTATESQ